MKPTLPATDFLADTSALAGELSAMTSTGGLMPLEKILPERSGESAEHLR